MGTPMMETQARDGNVLGMSRSVPSSPGERSPSDKFSPGGETPGERPGVQPETAGQGAQVTALPVISVWSSQPHSQDRPAMIRNCLLYRQTTLESPCYQPSPHHRHPYHSVSPNSSPQPIRQSQDRTVTVTSHQPIRQSQERTVTFAGPASQVEIVPTVEILEFSPSTSLTSDCSADTP